MVHKFVSRKGIGVAVKTVIFLLVLAIMIWNMMPQGEKTIVFTHEQSDFLPAAKHVRADLSQNDGLIVYAEDDRHRLSADLGAQLFMITDKQSGYVWTSSPDLSQESAVGEASRHIANSPVMFTYTTKFKELKTTSLFAEKTSYLVNAIDKGLQIHYRLDQLGISFVMEVVLEDGGLSVRFPHDSIVEEGNFLTSIIAFPMFGAAKQGESGYMVIPDGTGAITHFNQSHKLYDNRGYEKWIYGIDPTFDTQTAPIQGEPILIPAIGMVKEHVGYVQTATQGSADAKLYMNPPGVLGLDYYRGGVEFIIRKSYYTRVGGVQNNILRIEQNMIIANRELRFDFVSGKEVSYVQLAKAVKHRLLPLLDPATSANQVNPSKDSVNNTVLLRLFMSVETRGGGLSKKSKTTTTFDEAQTIAEFYKAQGLEHFELELKGWYDGGYFGRLPGKFPVESKIGGNSGMKKLIEWANESNIPLSVENNDLDVYHEKKANVSLRNDVVRKPDGSVYSYHPIGSTGWYRSEVDWYTLRPEIADKERINNLEKLKMLGVSSINERNLGEQLFSDYSMHEPLRRSQTAAYFEQWLAQDKEKLGSAGVYGGHVYALKHADRILDMTQATSSDYLLDEQIPFVQLIYHGVKPYYTSAINLADLPQTELLRAVEYGAIPSFELTYLPTTDLKYTYYDKLFSAQYEEWRDTVLLAYKMWQDVGARTVRQEMIDHLKLNEDVSRTMYEDGTTVWVNYGESVFMADGIRVEPSHYTVRAEGS
ncbi:hypothetical protein H7F31_12025 [Paenibacillus sp. PAMC21692]|nr:hypothetical protein H7F31_12025 [Paenibacillus sp. PAMC21692]